MINFNLNITNPWSTQWHLVFCKFGPIGQYKAWEFNGYKTHHLVEIDFRLSVKGDHPGLSIMLGLFGFALEASVYDTRHGR